jgi:acyl-[acyl carrier protein]--UDP-N-acetylglucosamine O-acyltransferase
MVNTHIAHDCVVGDHNIFANNVGVAGHVHIGDYVVVVVTQEFINFVRLILIA